MKTLFIASIVCASLSCSVNAAIVSETKIKFVGDTEFAPFCQAIMTNDLNLFKVSLNRFIGELGSTRVSVLRRVVANSSVTCDGKDLIEFSKQHEATKIKTLLTTKA